MPTDSAFSVNTLAARWGIPADKVRAFITSGQLAAIDVSLNPGQGKPRYRILADAVEQFERSRSTVKIASPVRLRRRRTKPSTVIEFF